MWILPKTLIPLEPSASAMDMAVSNLESSQRDSLLETSLLVRSKPIPLQSHLRKCKKDKWYLALCGQISKHWMPDPLRDAWIYSQPGFLVSHSRLQEVEKPTKTQDTYFQTSLELSMSADQEESSLKMSKESSQQKCMTTPQYCSMSLEHWKAEVTEQRGLYSARKNAAHLIEEKESLSWPTARTSDAEGGRIDTVITDQGFKSIRKTSNQFFGAKLRDAVETSEEKKWLTPSTVDIDRTPEGMEKRKQYRESIGRKYVEGCLTEQVKNQERSQKWATPRTCSAMTANITENTAKAKHPNLETQVAKQQSWPTPTTRDHKGVSGSGRQERKGNPSDTLPNAIHNLWPTPDVAQAQKVSNRPNYGQLGLANHPQVHGKEVDREPMKKDRAGQPGQDNTSTSGNNQESYGKLNSAWVEQLMGLPTGWTDLDFWEME